MDWILPLIIFAALSTLLVLYVRSQLADKDNNNDQSRNIIYPGSVQTSYPRQKPKTFIPISQIKEAEAAKAAEETETPPPPGVKKGKSKSRRRMPLTREDIIRSYLIDELLDRKTK